jgi:hypothetical protein
MFHDEVLFAFPIDITILYKGPQYDPIHNLVINCIHVENNIEIKARQKVPNASEERTTLYMYTCIVGNQW